MRMRTRPSDAEPTGKIEAQMEDEETGWWMKMNTISIFTLTARNEGTLEAHDQDDRRLNYGCPGYAQVIQALFKELLRPEYATGVVVDGFPRTKVECVRVADAFANVGDTPNAEERTHVRMHFYDVRLQVHTYRSRQPL